MVSTFKIDPEDIDVLFKETKTKKIYSPYGKGDREPMESITCELGAAPAIKLVNRDVQLLRKVLYLGVVGRYISVVG